MIMQLTINAYHVHAPECYGDPYERRAQGTPFITRQDFGLVTIACQLHIRVFPCAGPTFKLINNCTSHGAGHRFLALTVTDMAVNAVLLNCSSGRHLEVVTQPQSSPAHSGVLGCYGNNGTPVATPFLDLQRPSAHRI